MALLRGKHRLVVAPQALVLQEQRVPWRSGSCVVVTSEATGWWCDEGDDLMALLRGKKPQAGGGAAGAGATGAAVAGGAQDLASLLRGQKPLAGTAAATTSNGAGGAARAGGAPARDEDLSGGLLRVACTHPRGSASLAVTTMPKCARQVARPHALSRNHLHHQLLHWRALLGRLL